MNKLVCAIFLILIVGHLVNCQSHCPAGYYDQDNSEQPCGICQIGYYCPGNGQSYSCPGGTIAPQQGAASCTKCDSNRSNSNRDMCLLKDTPADAIEIFYNDQSPFVVSKSSNFFMTVYMERVGPLNFSAQITFTGPNMDPQLLVYASTKSGSPSSSNNQYFGSGLNATLSFNQEIGSQFIVYFNLQAQSRFKYYVKAYFPYDFVCDLKESHFELYHPFIFQNWILFKKENVTAGASVGIKFRLLNNGDGFNDPVNIMYSTVPTLRYLNPNNANLVVRGKDNEWMTVVFKQIKTGPLIFGVNAFYYSKIIQVDVL